MFNPELKCFDDSKRPPELIRQGYGSIRGANNNDNFFLKIYKCHIGPERDKIKCS